MSYPTRKGYRLKPEWEEEYTQFRLIHGREGNCSCHLCAPCGSCSHDGHPSNIEACDEAWEPEELDFEMMECAALMRLQCALNTDVAHHLECMRRRSADYRAITYGRAQLQAQVAQLQSHGLRRLTNNINFGAPYGNNPNT